MIEELNVFVDAHPTLEDEDQQMLNPSRIGVCVGSVERCGKCGMFASGLIKGGVRMGGRGPADAQPQPHRCVWGEVWEVWGACICRAHHLMGPALNPD